ncbi:MAG: GxxExxY protein [Candidatus Portnoybacteria bacterium]|nr:GxxExxY protein [Candidatus Portnoybacteria bacterium]MDD4982942.1 GxxExxY protein [Candidatus Portnoybacteria bacterium]
MVKIRDDLVYPELSYKIVGILFNVWSNIGSNHKEVFYQRAVAKDLERERIVFIEQLPVKINYRGSIVGKYFFDFLIDDKIVLEIKVRDYFSKKDISQLYSYLKAKGLMLGIIAHFSKTGVKFKRVLNIK